MTFERTDENFVTLKAEVANDPLSLGYAQFVFSNTKKFLELLNNGDKNVGGATTNVSLTTKVLLDVMVPSDLGAQQVDDGERRFIESFMVRDFGTDIEPWRDKIRNAFRTGSDTITALDALIRLLSRAEVLFGEGTHISSLDWAAARDS